MNLSKIFSVRITIKSKYRYIFFICINRPYNKLFQIRKELSFFNNNILTYDILLFNGHQEVLIFSIFTLFSKYFYLIIKSNVSKGIINYYSIIILLLFLCGTWTKNEAMFFSFTSMLLILFLPKKSSLFRLSIFFSFFFIIALRFLIFKEMYNI